jgi:hypothetical protein
LTHAQKKKKKKPVYRRRRTPFANRAGQLISTAVRLPEELGE